MREEEERVKRESGEDEKLMEELRKGIRIYKYIGETARSIYERALEHKIAMDSLSSGSYMLKHCIDRHEGEAPDAKKFGVKVLKFTKTSFERQILESVKLEENIGHNLLNSKSEYNRCAIPRLTTKIGEKMYQKWEKNEKEEKIKEVELEEKIRNLQKERNRGRRNDHNTDNEKEEKRRIGQQDKRTMMNNDSLLPDGWKVQIEVQGVPQYFVHFVRYNFTASLSA